MGCGYRRSLGGEPMFLDHGQVVELAAAAEPYGLLVRVLAYTGLRWGEMSALRVGSLDLLRRRVRIRSASSRSGASSSRDAQDPPGPDRAAPPLPRRRARRPRRGQRPGRARVLDTRRRAAAECGPGRPPDGYCRSPWGKGPAMTRGSVRAQEGNRTLDLALRAWSRANVRTAANDNVQVADTLKRDRMPAHRHDRAIDARRPTPDPHLLRDHAGHGRRLDHASEGWATSWTATSTTSTKP